MDALALCDTVSEVVEHSVGDCEPDDVVVCEAHPESEGDSVPVTEPLMLAEAL
jgi:hypothetical protein